MRLPEPERIDDSDNMLPLINVVFLLLIFFILVGAFHSVDLFEVEPPESTTADANEAEPPLVLVGADGRLAIGEQQVDELDLQLAVSDLLAEQPSAVVRVKADLRSEARRVVEVMEMLNAMGVEQVLLLTLEPEP